MNNAHLHLILVHLPIVLVPFGTVLLAIAFWLKQDILKNVAYGTFVFASIFAGISYLLGEEAEEAVEHLAGILESAIEDHEDASVIALWSTVVLGTISLYSLLSQRFQQLKRCNLTAVTLIVGIFSSCALAYTAQQGGKIRHPEAYDTISENGSIKKDLENEHDSD